jgi:hypothetical protein
MPSPMAKRLLAFFMVLAHPHPHPAQSNMTHCPMGRWDCLNADGEKARLLKKSINPPSHPNIISPTAPKPIVVNKSRSPPHHHPTHTDFMLAHTRALSNGSISVSALLSLTPSSSNRRQITPMKSHYHYRTQPAFSHNWTTSQRPLTTHLMRSTLSTKASKMPYPDLKVQLASSKKRAEATRAYQPTQRQPPLIALYHHH